MQLLYMVVIIMMVMVMVMVMVVRVVVVNGRVCYGDGYRSGHLLTI